MSNSVDLRVSADAHVVSRGAVLSRPVCTPCSAISRRALERGVSRGGVRTELWKGLGRMEGMEGPLTEPWESRDGDKGKRWRWRRRYSSSMATLPTATQAGR